MKIPKHSILGAIVLAAVMIAFAVFLVLEVPDAGAARSGAQSNPPANGDWIINTTGNSIDNETLVVTEGPGDPPSIIYTDNRISLKGNLTITADGELNLSDVWIMFDTTEDNLFHINVEAGGTLNIYYTTFSPYSQIDSFVDPEMGTVEFDNMTGPDLDYVDIQGNLTPIENEPLWGLSFWHVRTNVSILQGNDYWYFGLVPGSEQAVNRTRELRFGGDNSFHYGFMSQVDSVIFEGDVEVLDGTGFSNIEQIGFQGITSITGCTFSSIENLSLPGNLAIDDSSLGETFRPIGNLSFQDDLFLNDSSIYVGNPIVLDSQQFHMIGKSNLVSDGKVLVARDSSIVLEEVRVRTTEKELSTTIFELDNTYLKANGSYSKSGNYIAFFRGFNGIVFDAVDSELELDTLEIYGEAVNFSISLQAFSLKNCQLSLSNSQLKHITSHLITSDDSTLTIRNCTLGLNETDWWSVPVGGMLFEDSHVTLEGNTISRVNGDLVHWNGSHGDFQMKGNNISNVSGNLLLFDGIMGGTLLLENNEVVMVDGYGFFIIDTPDVVIENNNIIQIVGDGVHLERSPGATITGNTIFDTDYLDTGIKTYGIFINHPSGEVSGTAFIADNNITGAHGGGYDIYAINEQPEGYTDNLSDWNILGSKNKVLQEIFVSFVVLDNDTGEPWEGVKVNASHQELMDQDLVWRQDFERITQVGGTISEMVAVQYEIIGNTTVSTVISRSPLQLNLSRRYNNVKILEDNGTVTTENLILWSYSYVDLDHNGPYTVKCELSRPDFTILAMNMRENRVGYPEGRPGFEYFFQNYGETSYEEIPVYGYHRPVEGGDWERFQIDNITIPTLLDPGEGYVEGIIEWFSPPVPGRYNMRFEIDPGNVTGDRDQLNNGFTLEGIMEVRQRPMMSVSFPTEGETVSGTVTIFGTVFDLYDSITDRNQIQLYLEVDGVMEHVNTDSIILQEDSALETTKAWSYEWVTDSLFDMGVRNGEVRIAAKCWNEQDDFYDSEFFNLTVLVHNAPSVVWDVDLTETYPFVSISLEEFGRNEVEAVSLSVDGGEPVESLDTLSKISWGYRWDDFADYSDGDHSFRFSVTYDAGDRLGVLNFTHTLEDLNSPGESTLPQFTLSYNETSGRMEGTAWDDNGIHWVKVKVNDGNFNEVTDESGNDTWYTWSFDLDISTLPVGLYTIYVKVSDGLDEVEDFVEKDNPRQYDLSIVSFTVTPQKVIEEDTVVIRVGVKNNGPHAIGSDIILKLEFFNDGEKTDYFQDSAPFTLSALETKSIQLDWPAVEDVDEIRATLNPYLINKETDDQNNAASSTIEVTPMKDDDSSSSGGADEFSSYLPILIVVVLLAIIIPVSINFLKSHSSESRDMTDDFGKQSFDDFRKNISSDGIVDVNELEKGSPGTGTSMDTGDLIPGSPPPPPDDFVPESLITEKLGKKK